MDTYDPDIDNPYPTSEWNEITKVEYISPLILRREAAAIQTTRRVRVDADYIVGEKYEMAYRLDEERRTLTVPKGMLTDLSSSPRFAALVGIRRVGRHLEASIVHDFLYIAWQYLTDGTAREPREKDRRFADELMLSAMESAGVGWTRRHLIYGAVRGFGWGPYEGKNPDNFVVVPDGAAETEPAEGAAAETALGEGEGS